MNEATCRRSSLTRPQSRGGVAVLLVVAVLAITLAIVYALSKSSSTSFALSSHHLASLRAGSAVDFAPATALNQLAADADWMPSSNPMIGKLDSGEPYQVNVTIKQNGSQRSIASTAQVYSAQDMSKLAEQLLTINLTKQVRNNHPTSAIAAFATNVSLTDGAPVYVAAGTTIRGNVRSKGPIQFQMGFVLQGIPYVMGNVAIDGTGSANYVNYRAAWGETYSAPPLANYGVLDSTGVLTLSNLTLGPSAANPMGVYYHNGPVLIDDNVNITGTLAVEGDLTIIGTGVSLFALQQASDPVTTTSFKTSFPAMVVNGTIGFELTADAVRISGVVLASQDVIRPGTNGVLRLTKKDKKAYACTHDHTLTIDAIPNPFATLNGPAIYVKGSIVANRIQLHDVNLTGAGLPKKSKHRGFALVFDATRTDTTDAPGFFTWRAAEWVEAN